MARPSQLTTAITELLNTHHVLSAPDIGDKLAEQGHRFNKTSIYRALEKLQSQHAVCQHNFTGTSIVYELTDSHHDHLVCTTCGQVTATDCQISSVKNVGSFAVDHHHATWFGTCSSCQKQI